jgi:hypothetical protein
VIGKGEKKIMDTDQTNFSPNGVDVQSPEPEPEKPISEPVLEIKIENETPALPNDTVENLAAKEKEYSTKVAELNVKSDLDQQQQRIRSASEAVELSKKKSTQLPQSPVRLGPPSGFTRPASNSEASPKSPGKQVKILHPKTKQVIPAGLAQPTVKTLDSGDIPVLDSISPASPKEKEKDRPVLQLTDAQLNERFILVLQRDFCNLDQSLLVQGRAFILESRAIRTKSFGRRDEYTIHLFSDIMMYSEKTVRGFYLHKILPLELCSVKASPEEHPYAFSVSCKFDDSEKEKVVTFFLETLREFLLWLYQLRLFIKRTKSGLKGKPKHWHAKVEESRFSNRKTYWLLQRKNRLKEKIKATQDGDDNTPYVPRSPRSANVSKRAFGLRRVESIEESDNEEEFKAPSTPKVNDSAIMKSSIAEDDTVTASLPKPLKIDTSLPEQGTITIDDPLIKNNLLKQPKSPNSDPLNRTLPVIDKKFMTPQHQTKASHVKGARSVDALYTQPMSSKFKLNRSKEELVIGTELYNDFQFSRNQHQTKKQKLLEKLQQGAWLTKHDGKGNELIRWFRVSEDGSELQWGKNEGKSYSSANLADVTRLEFGPFSQRFRFYRWEKDPERPEENARPWLCFTLYFFERDRTIDIECNTEQELRDWFLGLQYLIPLWSAFTVKPGQLLWTMINMKVDQYALEFGLTRSEAYMKLLSSNQRLPQAHADSVVRALLRKNSSGFLDKRKKKDRKASVDADVEPLSSPKNESSGLLPSNDDPAMLVPSSEKTLKSTRKAK